MKDGAFPPTLWAFGAPIYKDLAITGSHTQDSPGLGPRDMRAAFDVRTGKLVWTFDSVPAAGRKRSRNVAQ